jgi:hypothetical protein
MNTIHHILLGKGQGNNLYNVGDEGNHLYKDFPQKGEIMRIFHNIQEVEIVEDMGGSMPRIYAALDNKKAYFKSPMIEV